MFLSTIEILWTYRTGFLLGMKVTLELVLFIWVAGMSLGVVLGILGKVLPRAAGWWLRSSAAVLSAVPAIVLLFWAYFPLQMILGVDVNPFWTAAITLATLNSISVAEIVRSLLVNFPRQFRDAARVCGLTPTRTFFRIELPLITREAIPSLLQLQVAMLHLTLFASLISVEDVFRVAQRINSTIYRPVEIYSAVAVIFILICMPLQLLASHLQRRLGVTHGER